MGEKPYLRRLRQQAARLLTRAFKGEGHSSAILDPVEFAAVFLANGGRRNVGMAAVAYDCDLERVDKGIAMHRVPNMLEIGTDKATEFCRMAEEQLAIQVRKDDLRVKRGNRQAQAVLEAYDSGELRWRRMDSDDDTAMMMMPDGREIPVCQQLKSYLVGSSDLDSPPLNAGVKQVVCFRRDDGRYYVGEETYDEDSQAIFVPLHEGNKLFTYPSEEAAHRSVLAAIEFGEVERLDDRIVGDVHTRMSKKLRVWKRGDDAKAAYEFFTPEAQVSDERQRVTTSNTAERVRPRTDGDLQHVADVGAKQSLRDEPLAEFQLANNRVDSE